MKLLIYLVASSQLLPQKCIIYLICFTSTLPEVLIWKLTHRGIFLNINSWFGIIMMFEKSLARQQCSKDNTLQQRSLTQIHAVIQEQEDFSRVTDQAAGGEDHVFYYLLKAHGPWISHMGFEHCSSSQPFCAPTNLHLRVQQRVFCKCTPPERISTSCFSEGWGSRRGARLCYIPFSPLLFLSQL